MGLPEAIDTADIGESDPGTMQGKEVYNGYCRMCWWYKGMRGDGWSVV